MMPRYSAPLRRFQKLVSDHLEDARAATGMTLVDVEEQSDLIPGSMARLFSGGPMELWEFAELCELYGVDAGELLDQVLEAEMLASTEESKT